MYCVYLPLCSKCNDYKINIVYFSTSNKYHTGNVPLIFFVSNFQILQFILLCKEYHKITIGIAQLCVELQVFKYGFELLELSFY